jgi:hypothetical protein
MIGIEDTMLWTDKDERKLNALKCDDISIGDTAYGREIALKKRELEAVTDHLSREERDTLRQKLNAMDTAEDNMEGLEPI